MSEYVIARTRGGLCNRIKCLISSQRIARKYSKELLLSWPVDEDCGCRFSDLFDNKIAEVSQEDSLRLSRERAYQVCDSWRLLTLPEENLGPKFSRAYVSREGNNIDFEYERIPLGVREDVLKYVRKLTPINDIIEKVGEFREKFDRASVSVNIRSWPGEDRSVFFNIRKLYKVLDREKAGSFFVVSDSAEVLGQIKRDMAPGF